MKLKMKSYIKPFEKELALMELAQLAHTDSFEAADNDIYKIEITDKEIEKKLIQRLTYWELVGEHLEHVTEQAILESTYDGNAASEQEGQPDMSGRALKKTRILRYGPHDLHEYKGKFFPQLVRACINISGIDDGGTVIDPFCGSGTTLCEGKVRGMKAVGMDMNPLSILISRVKTGILDIDGNNIRREYERISRELEGYSNKRLDRWDKADLNYLNGWFDREALIDISSILDIVEKVEDPVICDFFKVNLSNIIREISWQKDSDLRVRKEVTGYKKGYAKTRFAGEVESQLARLQSYLSCIRHMKLPRETIVEGNAAEIEKRLTGARGKCDLLITSPPYATALPYLDTDRLSIIVLGLMHRKEFPVKNNDMVGNREITEKRRKELWSLYQSRKEELTPEICTAIDTIAEINHKDGVGFRRRNLPALLAKYFLDMMDCIKSAGKMLKDGAMIFCVVGNNSTKLGDKKFVIETNLLLWDLAEKAGWKKEKYINMDMLEGTAGYRNNPGTAEAILIFRK